MLKKIIKKSLAGALAFCIASATIISLPHIVKAKQTFIINDDFQSETTGEAPSNWFLKDSKNGTLSVVEENGNKFLRLATGGKDNLMSTNEGLVNVPFSGEEPIIFKFRMRTNINGSERSLSRLGGSLEHCSMTIYSNYAITQMRNGGIRYAGTVNSNGHQGFTTLVDDSETNVEGKTNEWYSVTAGIIPSTKAVSYIISDSSGNTYTRTGTLAEGDHDLSAETNSDGFAPTPSFGYMENIERIVFGSVSTSGEHTIDIDDVQLYRVFGSGMTAGLLSDEGYIAGNSDIKIKFSKSVDTDTLTALTVVLKDKDGETVTCTERSYDESTKIYSLTPDENLTENEEYTVELADGIYAGNAGSVGDDIYDNGILTGDKSFTFTATRGKSSNAYLSSVTVNGEAIEGFDKETMEYTVDIQYADSLTMPVVAVTSEDGYAQTPDIDYPDGDIDGAAVTITSVAEDGVTKLVYKITFNVVGEELAKLGTNLINNHDFETGTTGGYSVTPASWNGFSVVSGENEKHSGSYGAMISGREEASSYFYKNTVSVKAGTTYLLSGWFRLKNSDDDGASFEIYPIGSCDRPYRSEEYVTGSSTEWKRVILTAETTAQTGSLSPTIISWANLGDYYVDDLYVGELKPVFNYKGVKKVLVPESGNKEIELKADIVNQFGTKNGLQNAAVTGWEIAGESCGAYINGDKLIVPADAEAGTVKLKATFDPAYLGDDLYTDEWSEEIEIEIFDDPELFPNAYLSSITVNGNAIEGFDKEILSYTVDVQYEENLSMPTVVAITDDAAAQTPVVEYPDGAVDGATVKITSVAKDGETQFVYQITFKVVGEELAKLGKNLLTNPGFETGTTEGYSVIPAEWNGFKIVSGENEVRSGSYAAVVSGREDESSYFYKNNVSAAPNRTYLLSGWFKVKSENDVRRQFEIYPQGDCDRPYRSEEYVSAANDEWKQVILTAETGNDATTLSPTILCWELTGNYYVDDLYVGELKPALNYTGLTEAVISRTENVEIALKADIINQFGTKNGLQNAAIEKWEVVSDSYGVYVEDGKLVVSTDAEAGTVVLKATFDPSYLGDDLYTDEWSKEIEITLTDDGDTTPKAKNITLSGTVKTDETLRVDYRYYQLDGDAQSGTQLQWLYSDTANGTYLPIPEATGESYIVQSEYSDKFIKVKVLPKSKSGLEGVWTESTMYLYKETAPEAINVTVTPSVSAYGVGDKLTGDYKYFDVNSDEEGTSLFRWLRYNSETGEYEPISGATEKTYTLTEADVNKLLKFEVKPVAQNDPETPGEAVLSKEINGPATPEVTDVKVVSKSSTLLAVSYKYSHPNGIAEGDTIVKWYVDGNYKGTGMSCEVSSSGTKDVNVEVTPIASKAPFEGETVTVNTTIKETSSGGGGGGGGGGIDNGKVVEIPQPVVTPTTSTPVVQKHWGDEAIAWAVSNGLMENTQQNPINPEGLISREKFLESILKVINLQPAEYRNEFADIEEGEFANLLQAAVDSGIISKYDKFYPERSVSREEICKIVITSLSVAGTDVSRTSDITLYADAASVSEWAKDYVSRMVGVGIMNGVSSSEFMPKGNVTMAQTAVILQRITNLINQNKTEG